MPELLKMAEAAARLGVTKRTVQQWVSDGKIPVRRLPGTAYVRIDSAALEALLASGAGRRRGPESARGNGAES